MSKNTQAKSKTGAKEVVKKQSTNKPKAKTSAVKKRTTTKKPKVITETSNVMPMPMPDTRPIKIMPYILVKNFFFLNVVFWGCTLTEVKHFVIYRNNEVIDTVTFSNYKPTKTYRYYDTKGKKHDIYKVKVVSTYGEEYYSDSYQIPISL